MTQPLDLDQIEARANAATEGPWCTDSWEIYQGAEYEPGISLWIGETCRGTSSPEQDRADAEFVAHARTDVPAMADEIRHLRAELATARATVLAEVADELEDINFHPNAKSGNGELCRLLAGRFRRKAAAEETHVIADDSDDPDTLPAWLYQRFAVGHIHPFEELDEANRSYWDHEARAVRRAVARGGFKTDPAAVSAAARP